VKRGSVPAKRGGKDCPTGGKGREGGTALTYSIPNTKRVSRNFCPGGKRKKGEGKEGKTCRYQNQKGRGKRTGGGVSAKFRGKNAGRKRPTGWRGGAFFDLFRGGGEKREGTCLPDPFLF